MPDIDAKKIEAGSLWRHKKRGSVYRVIDGSAQVQAPEDSGLTDYEVVVVYQSNAGETWVRRHSEFLDGRFEKLSEPPSKEWLTRMAAAEDGHEVGAGATLSLAGEDAEGLCEQLKVVSYGADEDDAKILQAARDTIRSLSLRVEAEKRAREETTEDTRSLCRFILSEWGPDGALKATTYSLEQREARSAKGGDANDSGPSRPIDATSPGVTAGASTLEAAETHSAALARALEELSAKVDAFWNDPERPSVHRMRSKSVHELSDAQRRARSLLAPKEDTANG